MPEANYKVIASVEYGGGGKEELAYADGENGAFYLEFRWYHNKLATSPNSVRASGRMPPEFRKPLIEALSAGI